MNGPPIAGVVCGRKFCSHCKRWRHAVDFHVRHWWDNETCEYPRTLTSYCRTCNTVTMREKRGHKPLVRTGTGLSKRPSELSKGAHERRKMLNRKSAKKRRRRKKYKAAERMYHRRWRARKAAEEGREYHPRPSAKYPDEVDKDGWNWNPEVNVGPFIEWWYSLNGDRDKAGSNLRVKVETAERSGLIKILTIDEVCTAVGRQFDTIELMDVCEKATKKVRKKAKK